MVKKGRLKYASRHHVEPSSRGGSNALENIAVIDGRKHQIYHDLFENMMPDEIIEHLVTNYWNGQWKYVDKAHRRHYGK